MKTIKLNKLLFAILLAITTLTVSCGKDEAIVKENSKIDTSDIMLSIGKGKDTISFYAAADWTAALSTTSWIKVDPMTRAGVKGEAKVIIEWEANASVKERIADLTIAVRDENPVKIRLTQLPEQAMLIVDKTDLDLVVKPGASNGRGQFVDTISVKSNIKWTLKNMPAWIDYSTVGDKEPQDGVVTDIKLVISADPKKFDKTVMSSVFQLGKSDNTETDAAINVSAETILKAVDKDLNPISTLTLTRTSATGDSYAASVRMISNSLWKLKECPSWAQTSTPNNATEYAGTLNTNIVFWFNIDTKDLDTEAKSGVVTFVNEQTKTEATFTLDFPGTGTEYFEYDLIISSDAPFDASNIDENWNEIPGAVTSAQFNMYTGRDYAGLNNAPFKVHFVESSYGIAKPIQANWAGVEMIQGSKSTKSPLVTKKLELYVQNRQAWEPNPYEARYAYMIVTPANVDFYDLFDSNDELKQEYESIAKLFGQHGLEEPKFESAIPELVSFAASGGEQSFEIFSGPSMIASDLQYEHPWIELNFEIGETGRPAGILIKTKPNTTGKVRSQVIKITEYRPATDTEADIYEFTVTQAAE